MFLKKNSPKKKVFGQNNKSFSWILPKKIKNFICNMGTVQTYLGKWGKKQISAMILPKF